MIETWRTNKQFCIIYINSPNMKITNLMTVSENRDAGFGENFPANSHKKRKCHLKVKKNTTQNCHLKKTREKIE